MSQESINIQDNIEIQDELIINIEVLNPLYLYFVDQITALKSLKDNGSNLSNSAVNIMFIPVLTMFVESGLTEIINEHLYQAKTNTNDALKSRLIGGLLTNNKSWEQYKDTFKVVFGWAYEDVVSHETVKAVNYLFKLRNKLIHGEQFSYVVENSGTTEESTYWGDNYKKLQSYFKEKKLINDDGVDSSILVNGSMVEHFMTQSMLFIKTIYSEVHAKHHSLLYELFKAHVLDKLDKNQ